MIQGRFHAATADTLTLALDEWSLPTHTIAKSAVYTVHARRPVGKRSAGWLALGGVAAIVALIVGTEEDYTHAGRVMIGAMYTALIGLPASLPGFLGQQMQRIYEAPPAVARLITQIDVALTNGDVVLRHEPVAVSVAHASRMGHPPNETVGLTVCLSPHPARCTGGWAVFEGRVRNLTTPLTATLRFGDEMVPTDTPVPIYVHVVLTSGPSWRPAPDQAVPQLGDPGVLDVETVTRRITVVDQ